MGGGGRVCFSFLGFFWGGDSRASDNHGSIELFLKRATVPQLVIKTCYYGHVSAANEMTNKNVSSVSLNT